jgi:IS1 family transposase/transposase-like protein
MEKKIEITRPPLESLACINPECKLYGQAGQGNLSIRKVYGKHDRIRYLRCSACQEEFSERKNTALWNCKIAEKKAVSVAEHLSEGNSIKGTARLVRVDPSTVRRLNKRAGRHGQQYHDEKVHDLAIENLQADERHGFVAEKSQPAWEAELMDPESKFVLSHIQGRRDEEMIRHLLEDGANRLADRHQVALFTDGDASYATYFPEIFGRAYQPARKGGQGRIPNLRYRIPRSAAHVQVIKHRQGQRLQSIEIRYTHGSQKRIDQALNQLGYHVPNTSAIERRNGTARLMSKAQVRKSLAFAKREDQKIALGWWALTAYNWCRPHRSLRYPLPQPQAKKSINNVPQLWPSAWQIQFFHKLRYSFPLCTHLRVGDNLT